MDIAFYVLGIICAFKYLGLLESVLAWSFLGMFMFALGGIRLGWYAYVNIKKDAASSSNSKILSESKALLDQAVALSKDKWQQKT